MLLVTGAAGFIGSNVVASLNEAGRTDIVVNDVLGGEGKWRNLASRQFADFIPPADLMRWLDGRNRALSQSGGPRPEHDERHECNKTHGFSSDERGDE